MGSLIWQKNVLQAFHNHCNLLTNFPIKLFFKSNCYRSLKIPNCSKRMQLFFNICVFLLSLNFNNAISCRNSEKPTDQKLAANTSVNLSTCDKNELQEDDSITKTICDATNTLEIELETESLTIENIGDKINTLQDKIISVAKDKNLTIFNKFIYVQVANIKKDYVNEKVYFTPENASVQVEAVFDDKSKQLRRNVSILFIFLNENRVFQNFSSVLYVKASTQGHKNVSTHTDVNLNYNSENPQSNASDHNCQKKKTTCITSNSLSNDPNSEICTAEEEESKVTCHCKFKFLGPGYYILLRTEYFPLSEALGWASTIGCMMSILGTAATLFVYSFFRELRIRQPTNFLINICICLLLINVVFLTGITRVDDPILCYIVTAVLHYLLLVCWFWMSANAYNMYQAFVKIMIPSKTVWRKSAIVAYTFPLLIVTINVTAAVFHDLNNQDADNCFKSIYKASHMCWLHKTSLHIGFLLPVAVLYIINCYTFLVVIQELTCRRNLMTISNQKRSMFHDFKIAMMLITMTGMSWFFGFLMLLSEDETYGIVIAWIFSILASSQGFFMFIGNCVLQESVRNLWIAWVKGLCKCKPIAKPKAYCYQVNNSTIVNARAQEGFSMLNFKSPGAI